MFRVCVPSWRILGVVFVLAAAPVCAQPANPLIGPTISNANARDMLDFSLSALEGYDDNLSSDVNNQVPTQPTVQNQGFFTALAPHLELTSRFGQDTRVGMTAASEMRYYAPLHRVIPVSYAVGGGLSTPLSRHYSLFANQNFVYAPALLYRLLPVASLPTLGDVTGSAPNYSVNAADSYSYGTTVTLSRTIGRRGTASVASQARLTTFPRSVDLSDARSYTVGPRVGYEMTRGIKLEAAYTPELNLYGAFQRTVIHRMEMGVSYDRPISARRRMTFAIMVGPIIEHSTDSRILATERTLTGIGGDINFSRQLTRTWSVRTAARRGVEFTEVLATPVITTGGTLAVNGHLFPRTDLVASTSYTTGRTVALGLPAHLSTYSVDTALLVALTRSTSLSMQYLRYQYTLSDLQLLLSTIPPNLTRNAFRFGITTAVPVWRR